MFTSAHTQFLDFIFIANRRLADFLSLPLRDCNLHRIRGSTFWRQNPRLVLLVLAKCLSFLWRQGRRWSQLCQQPLTYSLAMRTHQHIRLNSVFFNLYSSISIIRYARIGGSLHLLDPCSPTLMLQTWQHHLPWWHATVLSCLSWCNNKYDIKTQTILLRTSELLVLTSFPSALTNLYHIGVHRHMLLAGSCQTSFHIYPSTNPLT